jgi:hypothetical protein
MLPDCVMVSAMLAADTRPKETASELETVGRTW